MLYAQHNEIKTKATPGAKGICPGCGNNVIAKCGKIMTWHWAHQHLSDCELANKEETEWHLSWKSLFNPNYVEQRLDSGKVADVKLIDGLIIEFQNSKMRAEDFLKYEEARPNMVWVFNGKTYAKNLNIINRGNYHSIYWKWIPKTIHYCSRPIFIDLYGTKEHIFHLKKLYHNKGWGNLFHRNYFFKRILNFEETFMDLPKADWNLSAEALQSYRG